MTTAASPFAAAAAARTVLVALALACTASASLCRHNVSLPWRLPSAVVVPRAYHLQLHPDLGAMRTDGNVTMLVDVLEPTSCVIVHAVNMSFGTVMLGETTEARVHAVGPVGANHYALDAAPALLPLGPLLVTISFQSQIHDSDALTTEGLGFFRSQLSWNLEGGGGGPPFMYATQFEPLHAREAFPCMDEPGLKAVMSAEITAPTDMQVLFNTAPVSDEPSGPDGDEHTVTFAPTNAPITTYGTAWVLGELVSARMDDRNGVEHRVWGPAGTEPYLHRAVNISVHAVEFFGDLFDFPYPWGDKLDTVAVPGLVQDAMENIALVTIWSKWLDVDPTTASVADQLNEVMILAHEYSHMWFGNWVTCAWWSEVYMNEGMARYFQYLATQALHPEWSVFDPDAGTEAWATNVYELAVHTDAFGMALALNTPQAMVQTHADVEMCFSAAYPKGAVVNRWLNATLGVTPWNTDALGTFVRSMGPGNPSIADLAAVVGDALGPAAQLAFVREVSLQGMPIISFHSSSSSSSSSSSLDQDVLEVTQQPSNPFANIEASPLAVAWTLDTTVRFVCIPPNGQVEGVNATASAVSSSLPPPIDVPLRTVGVLTTATVPVPCPMGRILTFDANPDFVQFALVDYGPTDAEATAHWLGLVNTTLLQLGTVPRAGFDLARQCNNVLVLGRLGVRGLEVASAVTRRVLTPVPPPHARTMSDNTTTSCALVAPRSVVQDVLSHWIEVTAVAGGVGATRGHWAREVAELAGDMRAALYEAGCEPADPLAAQALWWGVLANETFAVRDALGQFDGSSDPLMRSLQPPDRRQAVLWAVAQHGSLSQYRLLWEAAVKEVASGLLVDPAVWSALFSREGPVPAIESAVAAAPHSVALWTQALPQAVAWSPSGRLAMLEWMARNATAPVLDGTLYHRLGAALSTTAELDLASLIAQAKPWSFGPAEERAMIAGIRSNMRVHWR